MCGMCHFFNNHSSTNCILYAGNSLLTWPSDTKKRLKIMRMHLRMLVLENGLVFVFSSSERVWPEGILIVLPWWRCPYGNLWDSFTCSEVGYVLHFRLQQKISSDNHPFYRVDGCTGFTVEKCILLVRYGRNRMNFSHDMGLLIGSQSISGRQWWQSDI